MPGDSLTVTYLSVSALQPPSSGDPKPALERLAHTLDLTLETVIP